MQNNSLKTLLRQLDLEIKKTETLDEQGIELLDQLAGDIQDLLDKNKPPLDDESQFAARLAQAIEHFESSHPTLTSQLSQLSMILSNAGI